MLPHRPDNGAAITRAEFWSRGPHPYVFFSLPFGVAMLAVAALAFSTAAREPWAVFVGVASAVLGIWVLASSAYSAWGRLEISRRDDRVVVTRSLGRWSRSFELWLGGVRHVERYTPPPAAMMWPGTAGPQVRVYLERKDRPLAIGGGLCLQEEDLRAIEKILCPQG
jgi:hypothetical protein